MPCKETDFVSPAVKLRHLSSSCRTAHMVQCQCDGSSTTIWTPGVEAVEAGKAKTVDARIVNAARRAEVVVRMLICIFAGGLVREVCVLRR
jgi:hypothetical protein